jgi:excisionase family DNA binding protein
METSPFMSIQNAANYLGVDYKTVYRLVQAGKLPAGKFGGMYRIRRQDLEDYFQAQVAQTARGTREGQAAVTPEPLTCGRCFRLIRPPREVAGHCAADGCEAPICQECWARGSRCAEHQPSDRQRLAQAQAALARGEIPVLVTALAARQSERAWMTRFDERIGGIATLYHPGTGEALRIADWTPFQQLGDETLQLMRLLNVGFLDKAAEVSLPHSEWSRYHIPAGKLGWGRPQKAILLEARSLAHLEAFVADGFDTRPVDLPELALHLADAEKAATSMSATGIIGLASPTGWDDAVIKHIIAEGGRAYRHPAVLPFLIDLGTGAVYHDAADERTGGFRYADLFRLPLEAEETAMLRPQIEALLVGRDGLPVSEVARQLGRPEALVQRASQALAESGRYKLVKDNTRGWVLLRNRD